MFLTFLSVAGQTSFYVKAASLEAADGKILLKGI